MVKISSLPHGFYEDQLKGYFNQFGDVTNVKVVRSLKTGRSKGVAFVEFSVAEVAEIAAETMNNYLLFKNLLKTEYIPPNKVKPGLFTKKVEVVITANGKQQVRSAVITSQKQEVKRLNAKPTEDQAKKRQNRLENKLKLKNKFLKRLGVDLKMESIVEGKVDLTTPVKQPSKAKKQNKITVKVTNDEPATEKKEQQQKPAGKKPQKATEEKAPTVTKSQPKAVAESKKKATGKRPGKPTKSTKAVEKEAKRAEWKKENAKKLKAKKVAKAKEETKVPVVAVAPTPLPAPVTTKKDKKAPATAKPVAVAAPAKKTQLKAGRATRTTATVPAAKVKPAVGKDVKVQKEKKAVAPKKSPIEKKKPLKMSPKKKSVK